MRMPLEGLYRGDAYSRIGYTLRLSSDDFRKDCPQIDHREIIDDHLRELDRGVGLWNSND